jgi:haloacid dehalogenase-like hydrolase
MSRLVDLYDGFLFDLNGLLDSDGDLIPYARETLRALTRVAFITNNVTLTPVKVTALLAGLGVAAHHGQVVTQSQAAARLVSGLVPGRSDEFVLGTAPTRAEDEPAYPPLITAATHRTRARRPLIVTGTLTCIAAARALRLPSVLLLTPTSDLTELLHTPPQLRPTFVATDIRDLFRRQPIVDCDSRYWSCEGWIATVSHGELRLYPGPLTSLAAGARVLCAAAWNWPGPTLETEAALDLFTQLAAESG